MAGYDCWSEFISSVRSGCCSHEIYPKIKQGVEPWNGYELTRPKEFHGGVLFILEAPPGGSDHFFWNPQGEDRLRKRFFELLGEVRAAPKFSGLANFIQELLDANCYLLPAFSYACSEGAKNSNPSRKMVEHSAREHLPLAINCLQPRIVVLMGEKALFAGRVLGLVNAGNERKVKLTNFLSLRPFASEKFGYRIDTFVTSWPTKRFVIKSGGKKSSVYRNYLIPTLNNAFQLLANHKTAKNRASLETPALLN
jgi:hypothetical protein